MLISQSTEYNLISPLDNFLDIQPNIDDINSFTSPRLLVTHVPYPYLPTQLRNGTGKIVHVQRNPKDLNVSMYNFLKGRSIRVDMPWEEYIEGVIGEGGISTIGSFYNIHVTVLCFCMCFIKKNVIIW